MTPPIDTTDLRKAQTASRNITALSSVLQLVDRALSGQTDLHVKVTTSDGKSAPAWTDGETIFLNKERVQELFAEKELAEAILTFKGTNYHELAHVLFSPRSDDDIVAWVRTHIQYKWAWNALEDQRIETLYTALYSPTIPYFRNSSYRWLLENSFDSDVFYRVYTLIGGRRYIDKSVRDAARAAFVAHYGAQVADELDDVVQAYVSLPLPAKTEDAIALITRFHNLLKNTDLGGFGGGCENGGSVKEGEIDPERIADASSRVQEDQEQERQEQAPSDSAYPEDITEVEDEDWDDEDYEDWGDQDTDQDAGDEEGDEDGFGQGEGAPSDGGNQGGDKAEGNAESGAQSQESGPEGQAQAEGEGGQSAGKGKAEAHGTRDLAKDLQDAVADALADTITDPDLKGDVDRTVEAFKSHSKHGGDEEGQTQYKQYNEVDASPDAIGSVSKIVSQLRTLKTDAEPSWIRERLNGARINIDHVIKNRADATHLEIFEEFDEGYEDEASTEVVIAIDISGSMKDTIHKCSEVLWTLKKSLDKVEIRTTVLGFNSGNVVLYKGGEKLKGVQLRSFTATGGTDPRETFLYAHRILQNSQATNKVLIVITDGIWGGNEGDGADPVNVVKALRQAGGHTLLFGVRGYRVTDPARQYGFEHCTDIDEVTDIVKIVRDLVKSINEKARAGR
jgi:Mg-chelatase subunit ChlD